MTRTRHTLPTSPLVVAAAAATLGLAAPASAAPTLRADAECVHPGEIVSFSGAGYPAGGSIRMAFEVAGAFRSDAFVAANPTPVDAAGGIFDRFPAPDLPSEHDTAAEMTVTAGDGAQVAAATLRLSDFNVFLDAPRVAPRGRMTLRAVGFIGSGRLWLHYVRQGRRHARVSLGAVSGPCGDLTKRMRQFPMRKVSPGRWDLYVSDSPTAYGDRQTSWVRTRIRVPR